MAYTVQRMWSNKSLRQGLFPVLANLETYLNKAKYSEIEATPGNASDDLGIRAKIVPTLNIKARSRYMEFFYDGEKIGGAVYDDPLSRFRRDRITIIIDVDDEALGRSLGTILDGFAGEKKNHVKVIKTLDGEAGNMDQS